MSTTETATPPIARLIVRSAERSGPSKYSPTGGPGAERSLRQSASGPAQRSRWSAHHVTGLDGVLAAARRRFWSRRRRGCRRRIAATGRSRPDAPEAHERVAARAEQDFVAAQRGGGVGRDAIPVRRRRSGAATPAATASRSARRAPGGKQAVEFQFQGGILFGRLRPLIAWPAESCAGGRGWSASWRRRGRRRRGGGRRRQPGVADVVVCCAALTRAILSRARSMLS